MTEQEQKDKESMNLFAVFKEGVYRHQCGGIFDDSEKAKEAAEKLRDGERDVYHEYVVVPFILNEITEQTETKEANVNGFRFYVGGNLNESPAIFEVGCRSFDS